MQAVQIRTITSKTLSKIEVSTAGSTDIAEVPFQTITTAMKPQHQLIHQISTIFTV